MGALGIGGWVGQTIDDGIDGAGDIARDIKHAGVTSFSGGVDFAADTLKGAYDIYYTYSGTEFLENQLLGSSFSQNVFNGTIDNVASINKGAVQGDWVEFRDGAMGTFNTAVAVVAIASGNPYLIAAGLVMLDAQHNKGAVLAKGIGHAGDVEEAWFGTRNIEENASVIQGIITVAASLYAANYSMPIMGEFTGVSAAMAGNASVVNYIKAGYGGYQVYAAAQKVVDSNRYYKEKLAEYEAALKKWMGEQQAAKNKWFDMMINPDMINRIQAGGDLFVMGAGHDLWSHTDVAEPHFALGIVNNNDEEMDKLINNRYYAQSAGSDGFRVN